MRAVGIVNIYSGLPNPEMDLSEDDAQLLITKVNQLTEVAHRGHSKLGFSGYSVWLKDNGNGICGLHVFDNVVTIYRREDESAEFYVDTAGLYSTLAVMLSSLYPLPSP